MARALRRKRGSRSSRALRSGTPQCGLNCTAFSRSRIMGVCRSGRPTTTGHVEQHPAPPRSSTCKRWCATFTSMRLSAGAAAAARRMSSATRSCRTSTSAGRFSAARVRRPTRPSGCNACAAWKRCTADNQRRIVDVRLLGQHGGQQGIGHGEPGAQRRHADRIGRARLQRFGAAGHGGPATGLHPRPRRGQRRLERTASAGSSAALSSTAAGSAACRVAPARGSKGTAARSRRRSARPAGASDPAMQQVGQGERRGAHAARPATRPGRVATSVGGDGVGARVEPVLVQAAKTVGKAQQRRRRDNHRRFLHQGNVSGGGRPGGEASRQAQRKQGERDFAHAP